MTTKRIPRGILNHNPGNIRKSKDKWQGLAPRQTDKSFFRFISAEYGIRALARILITYQDRHNINTIKKIVERWAPKVENNTEAYIAHLEHIAQRNMLDKLNLHSYDDLFPLVFGIILHENGMQPYTREQLDKGLMLAGVEQQPQ